ncbi:heterokaryon incompatibility protein-domain-containing protein [Leptodontidium sp. 2 PMI_412]|nr:heterokaryon incompatibility protein-domain-containing protein [Leptodontidium sp. 2 PMI_412]
MRLLQYNDDGKFTFTEYLATDVPKYAILSHTWGLDGDEVTYKDLVDGVWEGKAGFRKLTLCAKQAKDDRHNFFWMDTCCIDKSSSAELQEAINSMFRWYRDAAVCYVHLSDVPIRGSSLDIKQQISKSRWFTRGWTLQELLAPENIVFYSDDWECLGTKLDLLDTISTAAGIEPRFLKADMEELDRASISKKMSWASQRQTSRTEDEAYCLLGIFGINIPLLYGEGKNAFRRLQEEIMKTYPFDHTLFAWGTVVKPEIWSRQVPVTISRTDSSTKLPWDQKISTELLLGLFAECPRDFQASGDFTPWYNTSRFYGLYESHNPYPTTVGRAVRLEIPIIVPESSTSLYFWDIPMLTQERKTRHILLLCGWEFSKGPCVRIPVQSWGELSWGRTRDLFFQDSECSRADLEPMMQTLNIEPERRVRARNGDVILAQIYAPVGFGRWPNYFTGIHFIENEFVIRQTPAFRITEPLFLINIVFPPPRQEQGIIFFFKRLAPTENAQLSVGPILVSLVPVSFGGSSNSANIFLEDIVWFNSENAISGKPLMTRTLAMPSDLWNIDHPALPRIQLSSQRMSIDNNGSSVDVMRFFVLEDRKSMLSTASRESRAALRPGFTRTF